MAKIELDTSRLYEAVKKKLITTDEISSLVNETAEFIYKKIQSEVPYDTGEGASHLEISQIRVYPNQSWVTIRFEPKSWSNWKHLYFLNYDTSSEHYRWFTRAVSSCKTQAKAKLKNDTEKLLKSKGR